MPPTGRPPLAKSLKRLHGNPKPTPEVEEPSPRGPLDPPDWFDAEQVGAWQTIVDTAPAGTLGPSDGAAVAALAVAVVAHKRACVRVAIEGEVVSTPRGGRVRNPWMQVADQQTRQILRLSVELGLSAHSRSVLAARRGVADAGEAGGGPRPSLKLARYLAAKPDKLPN